MTDKERYVAAAHAVQSGVAYDMERNPDDSATSPKHLRVGLNVALSDASGLATLLIEKGVFTQEEYTKALADAMERERARYEEHLSRAMGAKITLV